MNPPILFAVGWIEIVIVLFFLISSVISRILQSAQGQRQRGGGREPLEIPPVGQRGEQRPVSDSMQQKIEKEIEVFLRKASGQRAPHTSRPMETPETATVSMASDVSVREPNNTVERSREQLAQGIESADERIESHLHQVFDHRLGTLGADTADTVIREGTDAVVWSDREDDRTVDSPLAEQVFELLSSPQQMRTAVVLNEILKRPDDPWSDQDR